MCVVCKVAMKNEEQFYTHAQQHGFQVSWKSIKFFGSVPFRTITILQFRVKLTAGGIKVHF